MRITAAVLCSAALLFRPALVAAADPAPPPVTVARTVTQVAPGVTLTSFERLYPFGWVKGHLIEADLTNDRVGVNLISAGAVTAAQRLSAMASQAGAVAAVNGDFFDINNTKAPLGPTVKSGELLKSGPETFTTAGIGADRIGRLTGVLLEGQVTTPAGVFKLASLNQWTVPGNGIGMYTPLWSVPRGGAAYGAATSCEVVVKDGKVVSVAPAAGTAPASPGSFILVGREEGAAQLSKLKVGDAVTVQYSPTPKLNFAVGGGDVLVRGGNVGATLDDKGFKPRSAIGFSADGKRMLLVTVDGRSEESGGLTVMGLARLMKELGAADALELDGGGSAQMAVRRPGEAAAGIINQPSDGVERPVPDGVGIFVPKGSGRLTSLAVHPVSGSDRVFPGLTRRLEAVGFDEEMGPSPTGPVAWTGADGGVARGAAGGGQVEARVGGVSGTLRLKTLGALQRIEFDVRSLQLEPGETATFRVMGYDADGYGAPIEPEDVTFANASTSLVVEPLADGSFRARMTRPGQAVLLAQVQGKSAALPVAVGSVVAAVTGFELPGAWRFDRYPVAAVSGGVDLAPGRTRNGLRVTYSFAEGATRAAYAVGGVTLPGAPSALGLWVQGDGKGAWLRAELSDRGGARAVVDLALHVDWTGWRYVEAAVPSSLRAPVRVERIYPVEADKARQYSGSLVFDDLLVRLPYALPEVPAVSPVAADPVLGGDVAGGWSATVVTAPGTARDKVKAAGGEVIILGGSAVAAYQGLAQETQTPVLGVTGGSHADWKGTRFIGLETGSGSLRTADFAQVGALRRELESAAADPAVKAVVLVATAPPSRYSDWREASMISRWLAEFRETSGGKPAAYLAGGAETLAHRYEGVPYVEMAGGVGVARFAPDPATAGLMWMAIHTQ